MVLPWRRGGRVGHRRVSFFVAPVTSPRVEPPRGAVPGGDGVGPGEPRRLALGVRGRCARRAGGGPSAEEVKCEVHLATVTGQLLIDVQHGSPLGAAQR